MTSASKFLEALRQGQPKGTDGIESVADYWARQQEVWVADLQALRNSIRLWLKPLTNAKAVKVNDVDFSTTEPDLGHYMAPGLTIEVLSDPPKRVDLRPRGARVVGVLETGETRVVGASGRVDLECELRREIVLRFRDDDVTLWRTFADSKKRVVDEEVFFELLSRVTNIHADP